MKINILRILILILIILNCSTIFKFSSEIDVESNGRSGRVVEFISNLIPGINNMTESEKQEFQEDILVPIVRKTAHLTIYTSLGMLSMCLVLTYKGTHYQKGLSSLVFCIIYSTSDEIHQLFVPGRSGQIQDVFIDTLGALIGILLICLLTKIYLKVRKIEKQEKHIDKDTKIMFISSTGGHFNELMQLKPLMDKCNYHIVTEKTKQNSNLKEKFGKKLNFLIYETKKKPFKYMFVLLANSFISLYIFLKFRPQVVVTTGTHTAGPMCCIARLLGSKVIYIETYANRISKTSAGKLLYYVANDFIVQWKEMLKLYPKAKYFGGIY